MSCNRKMGNGKLKEVFEAHILELKKLACKYVKDPYLAEDIVQEVFLKYFTHYAQIRESCCSRAWLYKVTENKCKDLLRSKYYQEVFPADELLAIYTTTPELELIQQQNKEELKRQICSLPFIYQEIIILFYVKELNLREIEQRLCINISTVKTRLSRAKSNLKDVIITNNISI